MQKVRMELIHPTAMQVCIGGTFNAWRPAVTPMIALDQGLWVKDLMLAPSQYEYRLVVDGVWMPDPQADETAPNPYGEMNSVLKVNGGTR